MAQAKKHPKFRPSNLSGSFDGKLGWQASRGRDDLTVAQRVTEAIKYTKEWDEARKQLAERYLDALVFGNGRAPSGLDEVTLTTVQRYFTKVCINLPLADGILPGQQQSWYRGCKRTVKNMRLPRWGR